MADVAVILPTYHRVSSLRFAIRSVINQSYTNWKLYVIGDGCTDGTEELVRGFVRKHPKKIVWHNMPQNHGGTHTNKIVLRGDTGACPRNTAFFMSKEPYIAYLDDDDAYRAHHLETLLPEIKKSGCDFVYSRGASWRSPGLVRNRHGIVGHPPPRLATVGTNSLVHTREIAKKILIPMSDKIKVPLTEKVWPKGTKLLKFPCCCDKPGILWLPAKVCNGCHDWDLIRRMLNSDAKWKFIPIVTHDIYWDLSQEQFRALVINNPQHLAKRRV